MEEMTVLQLASYLAIPDMRINEQDMKKDGKPFLWGHKGCSITHNGPTQRTGIVSS